MDWFKGKSTPETHGFLPSNCWGFPAKIFPSSSSMNIIPPPIPIYRKPWFLPSNIGLSCKFSHHLRFHACRMVLSRSPVLAVKPWKTRCGLASDMVGGLSAKSWRSTTLDKPWRKVQGLSRKTDMALDIPTHIPKNTSKTHDISI